MLELNITYFSEDLQGVVDWTLKGLWNMALQLASTSPNFQLERTWYFDTPPAPTQLVSGKIPI